MDPGRNFSRLATSLRNVDYLDSYSKAVNSTPAFTFFLLGFVPSISALIPQLANSWLLRILRDILL
jgi:hypothetical protein